MGRVMSTIAVMVFCACIARAQSDCALLAKQDGVTPQQGLQQPAHRVLQSASNSSVDTVCVSEAIRALGTLKSPQAIPLLIKRLSFEQKPRNPNRLVTREDRFPAISALFQIGEPAVPALVDAIANSENPIVRSNAVESLMLINRTEPLSGLRRLRLEAEKRKDPNQRQRLLDAERMAKGSWCKAPGSCEETSRAPNMSR
jgi:PBS lyase HEAT-like repeat